MDSEKIYLNLGCGTVQPHGWINIDGSYRCWFKKLFPFFDWILVKVKMLNRTEFKENVVYQNLNKRFKFNSCYADAIYGGEILEHFSFFDGASFLCECYRILKKGGIIRICVPDNYMFWVKYTSLYKSLKKLESSERKEEDIIKFVKMMFDPIRLTNKFYKPNFGHKWAYDELSLEIQLKKAGFVNCKRMDFHESEIPDIDKVEVSNYLIMEAEK